MDRRKFFKKISLEAAILSSGVSLTQNALSQNERRDYSIQEERDKILAPTEARYAYTKNQLIDLYQQQSKTIDNQILPNDYEHSFWDNPRQLHLKRSQTGEILNIIYFKERKIDLKGYWNAAYILRDVQKNQMVYPDLKLLDLLCAVQAWMRVYGNFQPLIINSGYRTQSTNSNTEGAAKNSMHLLGKAVDFVVPGLSPIAIGKLAQHFHAGGVGIYLEQRFNHLDTDRVRTWLGHIKK